MSLADPLQVAAIMRQAAAAEILPRWGRIGAQDVREKKPGQLVTDADVCAEAMMARLLADLLPGSLVVGEEAVDADPDLLLRLEGEGTIWVLDPVDGTANFAKGIPRFAVIVALVVDGTTRAGWILDPLSDRLVFAEAGLGAWMGGLRLSIASQQPLTGMRGAVRKKGRLPAHIAQAPRGGSAAHDYLDLATGQLDFAHFKTLMPWDHAAGVLIHAEAGGVARLLDGRPYRPVALPSGQLLLAPGESVWRELAEIL